MEYWFREAGIQWSIGFVKQCIQWNTDFVESDIEWNIGFVEPVSNRVLVL